MSEQGHSAESDPRASANARWERELVTKLASASITEQRRARRWGIFFKLLFAAYLGAFLYLSFADGLGLGTGALKSLSHTALVEVNGVIADGEDASADNIVTGLRRAFEAKSSEGVVLRINSPGGSPVQSRYVYDEIKRLREEYPDKPVYAVISDMGASGAYYIASAADEIYANESSIVGSIGVIMSSFGLVDAMDKLGVERRLYTAGDNKALLDPFLPERENEVVHIQQMLDDIHQHFIDAVREGRGERLKEVDGLFSGLVWTGARGKELGLVDAFGSTSYVAREVIGAEEIVDYTPRPDYLERFADRFGATMAQTLARVGGMEPAQLR